MDNKDQEFLDQLLAGGLDDKQMKLAELLLENNATPAPGDITEISELMALIIRVVTNEMFAVICAISTELASEMLIAPALALYNIGRARGKEIDDTLTLGDLVK